MKKINPLNKGWKLLKDFTFVSWHMIKELLRVCKFLVVTLLILVTAQAIIPYYRWDWLGRLIDRISNGGDYLTAWIWFSVFLLLVLLIGSAVKTVSHLVNQHFMESFAPYLPKARQRFGMSSFQRSSQVYNSLSEAERAEYSTRYLVVEQFRLFSSLLTLVVGLYIILSHISLLGWLVAGVALVIISIQIFIAVRMSEHDRSHWSDKAETTNLRSQFTYKLRMKNLILFGLDTALIERIRQLASKVAVSLRQMETKLLRLELLASFSLAVSFAFAIYLLVVAAVEGQISTGQLAFLSTTIVSVGMSIKSIVESAAQQALGADKLVDLFRFLHGKQVVGENLGGDLNIEFILPPEIVVRNLTFEYEDNKPILKNLNVHFPCSQVTYVVGANGVGKTTLFNLLSVLYPIPEESIYIDGRDLAKIKLSEIRKQIKHLSQDSLTLRMSIRETLALAAGLGDISKLDEEEQKKIEAMMWQALDWACLGDKVRTFYRKLDEPMAIWHDAKEDLSGGQQRKQNIAMIFMCVLYSKLSVLILDEPYQGIEPRHIKVISDRIRQLGVTTLISTHLVERILPDDNVVFLTRDLNGGDNTIAISGLHGDLLKNNSEYIQHCAMLANKNISV